MNDSTPPRIFTVVTSDKLTYNMDTVEYLLTQEKERRKIAREPDLSQWEAAEFRRQLISKLVIQGDAGAAITLRPTTSKKQLNG